MSILRLVSLASIALLAVGLSHQLPADEPQEQDIERMECRLRVVDSLGKPVKGATVTPFAFRTRVRPGTHWGWATKRFGVQPHVMTDDDGFATVKVPKFTIEKLDVGQVTWTVDHRDYVFYRQDHDVTETPADIKLQDGYRIAVTAVDADSQKPITEHLYGHLSGDASWYSSNWKLAQSGVLLSRTFDDEQFRLRVIALPPGGPARFSELLTVDRADKGSRVFLRNVPLHAGARVEGKLDDAVPRPVAGGRMIAYISAGANDEGEQNRSQRWWWEDVTEIRPDGSFAFESLPRGDVVQLIAVCDGWISRTPTKDEIAAVVPWNYERHVSNFVLPQVFALDEETIRPTIAMDPTASCQATVLDPDGRPLSGASVNMSPNQYLLRGGSTIVGFGFRMSDVLRALDEHRPVDSFWDRQNLFHANTNAEGVAVIHNLPRKCTVGLHVNHPQFVQPIENGRRSMQVSLKDDETTQITIRMEAKGKNVLGVP